MVSGSKKSCLQYFLRQNCTNFNEKKSAEKGPIMCSVFNPG